MSHNADPPADESAPYAVIDDSDPQLVRVRAVGPLTDAGYQQHLDEFWSVLEKREGRFALVLHQGRLRDFPTRFVRMATSWVAAAQQTFAGQWAGAAYVIRDPALHGAVRALFWSAHSDIPVAVFETEAEAETWARARVADDAP